MKFTLEINCDNAAFDPAGDGDSQAPRQEVARILRDVAEALENGADFKTMRDSNGNRVGVAQFN